MFHPWILGVLLTVESKKGQHTQMEYCYTLRTNPFPSRGPDSIRAVHLQSYDVLYIYILYHLEMSC